MFKFILFSFFFACSSFDSKEYIDSPTKEFNKSQTAEGEKYKVFLDLPYFEKTVKDLETNVQNAFARANTALTKIGKLKASEVSFENTIAALDKLYYEIGNVGSRVHLISSTSNIKELRKKASDLENEFSKWYVDAEARKDVYRSVQNYADKKPQLSGEKKKLFLETLRDYKRVGFHLSEKQQEEVKSLKKEMALLKNKIRENIKKSNQTKIVFTPEEMGGMPPSELALLEKDQKGNYIAKAGVAYQIVAVIKNSPKEGVRKKIAEIRNQRAKKENAPLIEKVLQIRTDLAKLLGYKNWADYKIATKMAKNGNNALAFVNNLIRGLSPKLRKEIKELEKLKAKDTGLVRNSINGWDAAFYIRKLQEEKYKLDMNSLKKYFEYEKTLKGMFGVFEEIFGVKIKFIEAPYIWDPKVKLVKISDSVDGKPKGFLYLDMFPRPEQEKYGHFAMFTIRPGKRIKDYYRAPVAALICNFPLPTDDKPSLLSFGQVETLFHEFGHALHGILTKATYASFAGTRVPRDFVEAPSQMLENWLLDKRVLDRFAVNYQNPKDKIPEDTLDKIKRSRLATIGISYRRQLAFAKMDLELHQNILKKTGKTAIDYTNDILRQVAFKPIPGTSFITAFGHLFGGYDAGYYGYAWSDSIAADMASVFEKSPQGFLDKNIGMRLRKEIYEVGDSRDVNISLKKYLGRKPNNKAFLKKLGI